METIQNKIPKQILTQFNAFEEQIKVLNKQMEINRNAIIELELKMFEFMYTVLVPEKQRKETAKLVKECREKDWKEAVTKAKGDERKAALIWAGLAN